MRVLILSWEYPPLIEGGLARHVRKLAENLVAQDVEVHVLTRGLDGSPPASRSGTATTSTSSTAMTGSWPSPATISPTASAARSR